MVQNSIKDHQYPMNTKGGGERRVCLSFLHAHSFKKISFEAPNVKDALTSVRLTSLTIIG